VNSDPNQEFKDMPLLVDISETIQEFTWFLQSTNTKRYVAY